MTAYFASKLTGPSTSAILSDSAMQMQKVPRELYHRSKPSWFFIWVTKYDLAFISFNDSSFCQIPSYFSSYLLEARMVGAMGKTAMYIMMSRLSCTAGLTLARLKVAVPV